MRLDHGSLWSALADRAGAADRVDGRARSDEGEARRRGDDEAGKARCRAAGGGVHRRLGLWDFARAEEGWPGRKRQTSTDRSTHNGRTKRFRLGGVAVAIPGEASQRNFMRHFGGRSEKQNVIVAARSGHEVADDAAVRALTLGRQPISRSAHTTAVNAAVVLPEAVPFLRDSAKLDERQMLSVPRPAVAVTEAATSGTARTVPERSI